MDYTILAPIAGVLALAFAGYLAYSVMKESAGTERMRSISAAVQEGAMAYLNRQYRTIAVIALLLALCIGLVIHPETAAGFLVGSVLSAAASRFRCAIRFVYTLSSARALYSSGPVTPSRWNCPCRS